MFGRFGPNLFRFITCIQTHFAVLISSASNLRSAALKSKEQLTIHLTMLVSVSSSVVS